MTYANALDLSFSFFLYRALTTARQQFDLYEVLGLDLSEPK